MTLPPISHRRYSTPNYLTRQSGLPGMGTWSNDARQSGGQTVFGLPLFHVGGALTRGSTCSPAVRRWWCCLHPAGAMLTPLRTVGGWYTDTGLQLLAASLRCLGRRRLCLSKTPICPACKAVLGEDLQFRLRCVTRWSELLTSRSSRFRPDLKCSHLKLSIKTQTSRLGPARRSIQ